MRMQNRLIRLIHWNKREAENRAGTLTSRGYEVDSTPFSRKSVAEMMRRAPAAIVIDLSRLPMQGRDVALTIRLAKGRRHIPIIFVEGDPAKVIKIKTQMPDAMYTTWRHVHSDVERAINAPPVPGPKPASGLAGYSATPLAKKLGIKPHTSLALIDAPSDFEVILGDLPDDVTVYHQAKAGTDLTIWFVARTADLEAGIQRRAESMGSGGLWILWPKKASGVLTDVNQVTLRALALEAGLVDYKVAAIDATWSGFKFAVRTREHTPSRSGKSGLLERKARR